MHNAPEPTILDVVEAPAGQCQMWRGESPERCENEADYLFVYDGSIQSDEVTRRNALACGHKGLRNEGGALVCLYAGCDREFGRDDVARRPA